MSLINTINGKPLFSTRREALAWAVANGLSGYHTHVYQNKTGYMGGATHSQATSPRTTTPTPTQTTTTPTSTPSTSSSGGGGGY